MKTFNAKDEEVKRDWFLIDAKGKTLGRLASNIATILRGKNKAIYTPHVDTGDYVVVVNAAQISVTGNKYEDKKYHHHTGYVGNLKTISFKDLLHKNPEAIINKAVKGMLPKGPLGRKMAKKMKVFADSNHTHDSQKPQILDI